MPLIMPKIIASLFVLLLSSYSMAGSFSDHYFPKVDFNISSDDALSVKYNGVDYHVDYEVYHEYDYYSDDIVKSLISNNMMHLIAYANKFGYKIEQCVDKELEFYNASMLTINSGLMPPLESGRRRVGAYSIISTGNDKVAIIVSSFRSRYMYDRVVAHEMAHYFYDRFCLWKHSNISSEDFATKYEADYMKDEH